VSYAVEQQIGVQDMTESQKVAAVVALNHLGYKVKATTGGVTIVLVQPGAPAAKVLRTSDVIVAADGHKVSSVAGLRAALAKHRPGDVVRIAFVRDGQRMTAAIKTVADPEEPKRALVGVSARDNLKVKLPVRIKIDAGGVGGPSAGLAFALDILQELGRNVAHGHKIAATGEIALDGTVGPDRRREAKDAGRAQGGCGRLPRPGRRERAGGRALCRRAADHPCEELSTGVAGAGNVALKPRRRRRFRHVRKRRKLQCFLHRQVLIRRVPTL
jgi:PDZ domain-containing protein